MPRLRVAFLIFVLAFTSGYKFRCYWFCTDQTSTQNDYVEARDKCREYAQLKLDMAERDNPTPDEKSRRATLVSLFSECMGNNGWSVPDGKDSKEKAGAAPVTPPVVATAAAPAAIVAFPPPNPLAVKAEEKASMTRQAECAFARNSADVSSIAQLRAKACDLECSQRLRAAPEAPRPAACPALDKSGLSSGFEGDQ